jgi:hypothetical protein
MSGLWSLAGERSLEKTGVFQSDPCLLGSFRVGQREALERVYRSHIRFVERYLRAMARARGLIELSQSSVVADLIQDVFVRAFATRARLSYDGVRDYGGYLGAIARNCFIDLLRTRGREVPTAPEAHTVPPLSRSSYLAAVPVARRWSPRMSPSCRSLSGARTSSGSSWDARRRRRRRRSACRGDPCGPPRREFGGASARLSSGPAYRCESSARVGSPFHPGSRLRRRAPRWRSGDHEARRAGAGSPPVRWPSVGPPMAGSGCSNGPNGDSRRRPLGAASCWRRVAAALGAWLLIARPPTQTRHSGRREPRW